MKERPILFNAAMVRAILSGKKTQTRRAAKVEIYMGIEGISGPRIGKYSTVHFLDREHGLSGAIEACPYGQVGDRLWVRETWMPDAPRDGTWADVAFYGCKSSPLSAIPEAYRKPEHCLFRSTWDGQELVGWKPSIHMPRWASRITLEITGVRVERLNEISEEDARAEGITDGGCLNCGNSETDCGCLNPLPDARDSFIHLWQSINDEGSWTANPWVWVLEFKRLEESTA